MNDSTATSIKTTLTKKSNSLEPSKLSSAVMELAFLKIPPGNRLEMLKGDRTGQYSIRINDQWRICFSWRGGDAYDVEIADYH